MESVKEINKVKKVQVRPQAGKQKLFDAAMKLFETQGYFATTVQQITAEAGVSKGLVYNYFSSKEELLVGLFENATSTIQGHIEILGKGKKVEESVSQFIDNFFPYLVKEQQFLKLQLSLMLTPELNAILQGAVKKRAESSLTYFTEWLTHFEIPEAEKKARLIIALLDGISLHYLSIYENYPLTSMKAEAKGAILKLILNSTEK